MKYKRMPIEVESLEEFGYEKIVCNLAESSMTDRVFSELSLQLKNLKLAYGDHRGHRGLRELIASWYGIEPNDVLITAGAAAALFIVSTSLLTSQSHLLVMHPN